MGVWSNGEISFGSLGIFYGNGCSSRLHGILQLHWHDCKMVSRMLGISILDVLHQGIAFEYHTTWVFLGGYRIFLRMRHNPWWHLIGKKSLPVTSMWTTKMPVSGHFFLEICVWIIIYSYKEIYWYLFGVFISGRCKGSWIHQHRSPSSWSSNHSSWIRSWKRNLSPHRIWLGVFWNNFRYPTGNPVLWVADYSSFIFIVWYSEGNGALSSGACLIWSCSHIIYLGVKLFSPFLRHRLSFPSIQLLGMKMVSRDRHILRRYPWDHPNMGVSSQSLDWLSYYGLRNINALRNLCFSPFKRLFLASHYRLDFYPKHPNSGSRPRFISLGDNPASWRYLDDKMAHLLIISRLRILHGFIILLRIYRNSPCQSYLWWRQYYNGCSWDYMFLLSHTSIPWYSSRQNWLQSCMGLHLSETGSVYSRILPSGDYL